MNYYPFHLGDYAAHTAHLEPMEDLAYRRMLDLYYLREAPLPADVAEVARLIRMRGNLVEAEAVLREFFALTDDGWRHMRCDAELDRMQDKQATSESKAAHESERMRRHRERRAELFAALRERGQVPAWDTPMKELQRLHDQISNAPETQPQREQAVSGGEPATAIPTPTPTPTPIEKTGSGSPLRVAPPPPPFDGENVEILNGKSVVPLAPQWALPEQWGLDAEALGWKPVEVEREAEKFRQYWTAGRGNGTRRSVKGWRQSWSTWLEKAARDRR